MSDYIVFRCKYCAPDGVCELYTDNEVTEYCIEGPCLHDESLTAEQEDE